MNQICSNCSQENVSEAKFCKSCGTPLTQAQTETAPLQTEETQTAEQATASLPVPVSGNPESSLAVVQETAVTALDSNSEQEQTQNGPAAAPSTNRISVPGWLKQKNVILYGVSAVALLIVLAAAWFAFEADGGSTGTKQKANLPLLYATDNALHTIEGKSAKNKLTDSVMRGKNEASGFRSLIQVSQNGSTTCFIENYNTQQKQGDLLCKKTGSDKLRVATDVYASGDSGGSGFTLTPDGATVAFLTDYDLKSNTGDLRTFNLKSQQTEKLASTVSPIMKWSPDGKSILFLESTSGNKKGTPYGNLYILTLGKDKVKVDTDVAYPASISNKGNHITYIKTPDGNFDEAVLYLKESGKDAEKLAASSVQQLIVNRDRDQFLILADQPGDTGDMDLYFKQAGKEREKIAANVDDVYFDYEAIQSYDFSTVEGILYLDSDNLADTIFFGKSNDDKTIDLYANIKGSQEKIASGIRSNVLVGNGNQTVAFMTRYDKDSQLGDLYVSRIVKGKPSEREKISDQVYSFKLAPNADTIYYLKDYKSGKNGSGKGDLYVKNGSKDAEKAMIDASSNYKITNDGQTAFVMTDYNNERGEFYVKTVGKDKKRLASDVYNFYTYDFKRIYFMKDWSAKNSRGDLFMTDLDGKSEKLDTDVKQVYLF